MSTTYKTISNDSYSIIARKLYGIDSEDYKIRNANPGVTEPLPVGTTLIIPLSPTISKKIIPAGNEVILSIEGERFRFWNTINIVASMDVMDVAYFSAPFESELKDFRDTFKPFSYKEFSITIGSSEYFKGIMIDVTPQIDSEQKIVTAGGYSTPGLLNDSTAPPSAFPLEFNNMGLKSIAERLAGIFSVNVFFAANEGPVFESVALNPTRSILSFLIDLAKQRNLLITNTSDGSLFFHKPTKIGNPVAILKQGEPPLLSVTPNFNPQQYYSSITGVSAADVGLTGSKFTIHNTSLFNINKPLVFNAQDSNNSNIEKTVRAKMGRMFGNIASYSVKLPTWRDQNNTLWEPNTTVKLTAPDAMIYNEYEFLIRSVSFQKEIDSETVVLDLILGQAFDDIAPDTLPWDD